MRGNAYEPRQLRKYPVHKRKHQLQRTVYDLWQRRYKPVQNRKHHFRARIDKDRKVINDRFPQTFQERADKPKRRRQVFDERVRHLLHRIADHNAYLVEIAVRFIDAFGKRGQRIRYSRR